MPPAREPGKPQLRSGFFLSLCACGPRRAAVLTRSRCAPYRAPDPGRRCRSALRGAQAACAAPLLPVRRRAAAPPPRARAAATGASAGSKRPRTRDPAISPHAHAPSLARALLAHAARPAEDGAPAAASRRALLAAAVAAPLLPAAAAMAAPNGTATRSLQYDTLAFRFNFPTRTASGREVPLEYSRKPERYSSAAPLTADARQRIVTELVSLGEGITVGVIVGPASGGLRERNIAEWTPREVANTVLADRSAARNTQGQRVPLATLQTVDAKTRGGQTYWVYETTQQVGRRVDGEEGLREFGGGRRSTVTTSFTRAGIAQSVRPQQRHVPAEPVRHGGPRQRGGRALPLHACAQLSAGALGRPQGRIPGSNRVV